jgi:hypothetical protein
LVTRSLMVSAAAMIISQPSRSPGSRATAWLQGAFLGVETRVVFLTVQIATRMAAMPPRD